MRKSVIAVRGKPNSGKTTVISIAHRGLAELARSIYSNPRHDATELKEVLEIEGVLIGFASAGDKPDRLTRMLRFLVDQGCVIIVCAARLSRSGAPLHKTIDAVKQFCTENEFDLEWIEKHRDEKRQEVANDGVATEIIAKVRKAITAFNLAVSAP